MKIFIPREQLAYPSGRGPEVASYQLLEADEPYLVNALVAELLQQNSPKSEVRDVALRPPSRDTRKLLILFPGGIGDVLCMKACLQALDEQMPYPSLEEVGFASVREDDWLINDTRFKPFIHFTVTVFDYPVSLKMAEYYDSWVSYGTLERQSINRELQDTFAEILGVKPLGRPARLNPDPALQRVLSGYIRDKSRIKVGMQIYSAAHYRSWFPVNAVLTAQELVKMGCDVYILGTPTQRLRFTKDGQPVGPPEHIYDMSGLLRSVKEFIAFASLMDAIITVDTALLHIAGCLYKPTLALFSITHGRYRTSYYPTVEYLQGEADCAPCLNIATLPDCGEKFCKAMVALTPDIVVPKFEQILKEAELL
ncbi:MAG: hypothetical protein DRO99_01615 [Candidatus Aenigmatarchaeota archaeon]|nr:MAG: hypothetical protein DRO99_01615 [Candidatus Aenigmarchaeota archaeon]